MAGVEKFANSASTVVTSGGTTAPPAGTQETWTVASAAAFPSVSASSLPPAQFHVADTASGYSAELVAVTATSGSSWTVTRGAENTAPVAHQAGFTVQQTVSAGAFLSLQSVDWLNAVTLFGADPSGAADSTTAIQDAVNALPAAGGVVYLPAGTYKTSSTVTATLSTGPAYIVGAGLQATTIKYAGSGDCLRMYNPNNPGNFTGITVWGGGVLNLTVDGSSAGASSTGLHIGDGEEYVVGGLMIQHFNGAGSIGLWVDNSIWWTEKMRCTAALLDNTTQAVLDVSSSAAADSFGYNDFDFHMYSNANQSGLVVQNGAHPYHASIRIRGNFNNGATSNSAVCVTVTGQGGQGNNPSYITNCYLDLQVETDLSGSGHAQTISVTGNSAIQSCLGMMRFHSTWAQSSIPAGKFTFSGQIYGDTSLAPAALSGSNPAAHQIVGSLLGNTASFSGANGSISSGLADYFTATLSANITVGLGDSSAYAGPQRKTIVISQPSSGGTYNYTVSWPHNASPTLSNPTVLWSGGAPTQTTGAGATDVYDLSTTDGATWYGLHHPNMV